MSYLTGEQIDKSTLKTKVGQRFIYLLSRDIDKSGRGYYFPRIGTLTFCNSRNIDFDDGQLYHRSSDLIEIVEATEDNKKANFK